VLSAPQVARFEERHGDVIRGLGYTLEGAIPGVALQIGTKTTPDPGIRLSADGIGIRPTTIGQGIYSFVVPPGRGGVLLESRVGTLGKVREPGLGVERRLGVKVSRIGVSSNAGEVVVAADDPRLIAGWHDAEQTASALWRWTDGTCQRL
jgi:hypothetical protein